MSVFEQTYYGTTLYDWLFAGAAGVAIAVTLCLLKRILIHRMARLAAKTATRLDDYVADIAQNTRFPFLLAVGLFIGLQFINLPPKGDWLITRVAITILLVQSAFWGNRGIALWMRDYLDRHKDSDGAGATTVSVLGFISRIALWSVIFLLILDNLGINITALVASLGIGGIAVALALQNILGDIFASLSIVMDKPFVIGDFIVVDDILGTVEYIGLKTTRLRSLGGEQIVFSNADLLGSRIRNYKRMYERRVVFSFGVTYQTPHAQLQRIAGMVREIVEGQSATRFDRAHFKEFGDSALNYEVVYFVGNPDYNHFMDIQQAINLELFNLFAREGIEFAYPTRTLMINRNTLLPE